VRDSGRLSGTSRSLSPAFMRQRKMRSRSGSRYRSSASSTAKAVASSWRNERRDSARP